MDKKRAKILSRQDELQNIDKVYASNCVRTLSTAKYLLARQNLKVNIDDRLDERRVGIKNDTLVKDWFEKQYLDEDYKTVGEKGKKDNDSHILKYSFNNKINSPEVFKLTFDDKKLINIENITFKDLPYEDSKN